MENNEDDELALLGGLCDIQIGRREKRAMCPSCSRPLGVCWCKNLGEKVMTSCRVIILQHPHEEKRCLRTAPILEALIPKENYRLLKGKKFNPARFSDLKDVLKSPNSILLYPGENALDLEFLPPIGESQPAYNIFILDGTWQQAKSMFHRNSYLKDLRQVRLCGRHISEYVIRRQPTDDALSTVEVVAVALSTLEQNWNIYKTLVDPLKLICQYQMNHGAVKHHSKEFLIMSGRYKRPVGKRTYKKFKKCGLRSENIAPDLRKNVSERNNKNSAGEEDAEPENMVQDDSNIVVQSVMNGIVHEVENVVYGIIGQDGPHSIVRKTENDFQDGIVHEVKNVVYGQGQDGPHSVVRKTENDFQDGIELIVQNDSNYIVSDELDINISSLCLVPSKEEVNSEPGSR